MDRRIPTVLYSRASPRFLGIPTPRRAPPESATRPYAARKGFLCGLTAAWVFGIEAQDPRHELVWVGRRNGSWRKARPGCLVREVTVGHEDLVVVHGALVTSPLRTVFDCARWLSLVEAVVVADAIAREHFVDRDKLAGYIASHSGLRGVRQARHVASLLDPRSESPMESRLRLLLVSAGFDGFVSQYVVLDERSRFVARVDFAYPDRRIVVEYDGAHHWNQRRDDDRRRDRLRALGWRVFVMSASDYYGDRQAFLAQLRQAFTAVA